MGLESGTYINSLNSSNPATTDGVSAGDDHIRLLKATIKATFPNVSGAVTPTHTEMNYLAGVTSAIQTQLTAAQDFVAGTRILFLQASVPTGWTQVTTWNDRALRIVSGTGGGTGGTHALSSPPSLAHTHTGPSHTHTGPSHTHTGPSHTHTMGTHTHTITRATATFNPDGGATVYVTSVTSPTGATDPGDTGASGTAATGAGGTGATGAGGTGNTGSTTPTAFAPQYVDAVVGAKD